MSLLTSLIRFWSFVRIHLSANVLIIPGSNCFFRSSFSIFISANLAAFQILLMKLRYPAIFSSYSLISFPGVDPMTMLSLSASAPYFLIMSRGSMQVSGFDLLIFLPWRSRIRPWRYTVLNGIVSSSLIPSLRRAYVEAKIILATQKKRISYPVSSTSVGWKYSNSLDLFGHPRVAKVHSAELNQVSSVSGSRIQLPFFGFSVPKCVSPSTPSISR